jgi:hypothetical protein
VKKPKTKFHAAIFPILLSSAEESPNFSSLDQDLEKFPMMSGGVSFQIAHLLEKVITIF